MGDFALVDGVVVCTDTMDGALEILDWLRKAPQNFSIGRDDFGWWYSFAPGVRTTGFLEFSDAVRHAAANDPY